MNHARDTHDLHRIGGAAGLLLALALILGMFHIFWGFVLCGALGALTALLLWRDLKRRDVCRSKRLALPGSLAQGIMAAEQGNIARLADALYHRVEFDKELSPVDQMIFDCLLRDLLYTTPQLFKDLKIKVDQDALHSV